MSQGFTLLECLCTLILSVFLSLLGYHAWQNMTSRTDAEQIHQVYHDLKYARLWAQHHNRAVRVCGTQDSKTCAHTWQRQYLICAERTHAPCEVLKVRRLKRAVLDLQIGLHQHDILFKANGRPNSAASLWFKTAQNQKRIIINTYGRMRIEDIS